MKYETEMHRENLNGRTSIFLWKRRWINPETKVKLVKYLAFDIVRHPLWGRDQSRCIGARKQGTRGDTIIKGIKDDNGELTCGEGRMGNYLMLGE